MQNYKYDPFGRRIRRTAQNKTRVYVYDGDNQIEELNSSGSVVARYTQGLGIDEPIALYRSGKKYYYHADGLGSIVAMTDNHGTPKASYTYDAFGNDSPPSPPPPPSSVTNPFRHTGRELDSETGLYYYRARYYDPQVGRFLSEDPIRFRGGVDFYTYVGNKPVVFADPFGVSPDFLDQLKEWLFGPPKPSPKQPPKNIGPVNLCEPGQTRLFSEAGPNPYYKGGQGQDAWSKFRSEFIDKCIAAKKPGKDTVTFCTQGAGILVLLR